MVRIDWRRHICNLLQQDLLKFRQYRGKNNLVIAAYFCLYGHINGTILKEVLPIIIKLAESQRANGTSFSTLTELPTRKGLNYIFTPEMTVFGYDS